MYKTIIDDITETKKSLLNIMRDCIFKGIQSEIPLVLARGQFTL